MSPNPPNRNDRFAVLLRETHADIRAYIAGIGVALDDVDDIAQDVYLEYYRGMQKMPADVTPIRWLKGIARNLCMNYFRRCKRSAAKHQAALELLATEPEGRESPFSSERASSALQLCLEKLPAKTRSLLSLKYEARKSSGEIADCVGMNSGAVRVALLRVGRALRDCVAAEWKGDQ